MNNYYKKFRGSPGLVRERLSAYLRYFKGCKKVLDLGCGRGEFLGLLKKSGIPAIGVDGDLEAIQTCCDAGYDVRKEDLFSFLDNNNGFDGIMASQLIEHFDSQNAERLIERCFSALQSGGKLIIITPNPGNLNTITKTFWLDPTHVRPYPLELLIELLKCSGFEITTSGEDFNTCPKGFKADLKRKVLGPIYRLLGLGQLRQLLFCAQDIYVVGRKP